MKSWLTRLGIGSRPSAGASGRTRAASASVATALRLRRWLAVAAIRPSRRSWSYAAYNGGDTSYAALSRCWCSPGSCVQLTTVVLMVVRRLCSQLNRVQTIDLLGALTRLAFISAAYFLFLNAAVAMLATAASIAVQYLLLRRWTPDSIDAAAPPSEEDRAEMLGIIKNQVPNSVFYCLQGQVTIWLIAVFAARNHRGGRRARPPRRRLPVVGAVMTSIILPGFARCQSPERLPASPFRSWALRPLRPLASGAGATFRTNCSGCWARNILTAGRASFDDGVTAFNPSSRRCGALNPTKAGSNIPGQHPRRTRHPGAAALRPERRDARRRSLVRLLSLILPAPEGFSELQGLDRRRLRDGRPAEVFLDDARPRRSGAQTMNIDYRAARAQGAVTRSVYSRMIRRIVSRPSSSLESSGYGLLFFRRERYLPEKGLRRSFIRSSASPPVHSHLGRELHGEFSRVVAADERVRYGRVTGCFRR